MLLSDMWLEIPQHMGMGILFIFMASALGPRRLAPPNGSQGPKWAPNGPKWTQMGPNETQMGPQWERWEGSWEEEEEEPKEAGGDEGE